MSVRVTKYNPALRDSEGRFLRNDWTCVSQVGSLVDGEVLAASTYNQVEDNYVSVLTAIAREAHLVEFRAQQLEVYDPCEREGVRPIPPPIELARQLGEPISGERLELVIRACLRSELWCKLVGEGGCEIHFGHDYYAYVTGVQPSGKLVWWARMNDIYVELFESPYACCQEETDALEDGEELG